MRLSRVLAFPLSLRDNAALRTVWRIQNIGLIVVQKQQLHAGTLILVPQECQGLPEDCDLSGRQIEIVFEHFYLNNVWPKKRGRKTAPKSCTTNSRGRVFGTAWRPQNSDLLTQGAQIHTVHISKLPSSHPPSPAPAGDPFVDAPPSRRWSNRLTAGAALKFREDLRR